MFSTIPPVASTSPFNLDCIAEQPAPRYVIGLVDRAFNTYYLNGYVPVYSEDDPSYFLGYDTLYHPTRAKAERFDDLEEVVRLMGWIVTAEGYRCFVDLEE